MPHINLSTLEAQKLSEGNGATQSMTTMTPKRSLITAMFPEMHVLGDSKDPENVLRYMVKYLRSMIEKTPDFDRSIVICSARSIVQSTTDLAEITLGAIKLAAYQQQAFVKATVEPIRAQPRSAKFKWRLH
ncbi:hypothetical protein VPNG_01458 [Cytospora leucostoma]|uniref:Uncharacterized protein n=1 Tax=Cytospora leucostoma TaxID=1230097 RepID=A0A423XJZ5_9PEZI|nr:hypothetical protein VPNG_01458 [Cytospora leucostoma]